MSTGSADKVVRKRLADGTIKEYRYSRAPKPRIGRYPAGSVGALIVAYKRSPQWAERKPRTQVKVSHYLLVLEKLHQLPARDIRRRHILQLRDWVARTKGPAAANAFAQTAAGLFAWARDSDWVEYSPADRIKALKGGSFLTWTEGECAAALAGFPEHLRRAVLLGLYTGQRRGDLIAMRWSDYDGRLITLRQEKTGIELTIPVHRVLRAELDAWKREAKTLTILAGAGGVPWQRNNLSGQMKRWVTAIGLREGLNVHGLRKLAAVRLAEAGCSVLEIAAITGHRSLSMVALYTRDAEQKRLAGAAIERLETGPGNQRKPA